MIDLEGGGDAPIKRADELGVDKTTEDHIHAPFSKHHSVSSVSSQNSEFYDTSQNVQDPELAKASPSTFERLSAPFRSIAFAVRGWEFSAPTSSVISRPVLDTVYTRDSADGTAKAKQSEENAETESLLSVEEKDEGEAVVRTEVAAVRTREEEHQILLEAMRARFVCPNYASTSQFESGLSRGSAKSRTALAGHMKIIPADKSADVDQVISRLDDALHERRAPFDVSDDLLNKLSGVQRKQLVLGCANLEMAGCKSFGPEEDDRGTLMKDNLATFHEMMDELSRDVLVLQNIDLQDASDTLPRRKSTDQPDLQGLHARLFRSQVTADQETKDLRPHLRTQMSNPVNSSYSSSENPAIVVHPTRTFTAPNLQPVPAGALAHTKDLDGKDLTSQFSEPPKYPPPPVPLLVESSPL